MTGASILPTTWIMRTANGWYPIHPSDQCKPEEHGRLNDQVVQIEDIDGIVLWRRSIEDAPGTVYPPRGVEDIAAYDEEEATMGFLGQQPDDPAPGENSSPAYRWGAQNRIRVRQNDDDGFDAMRHAFLAIRRSLN